MNRPSSNVRKAGARIAFVGAMLLAYVAIPAPAQAQRYKQINIVSDLPSLAPRTDPRLVNPWGLAASPIGPLWVADNGSGVASAYYGNGLPYRGPRNPSAIDIAPAASNTGGANPTGVVSNDTNEFAVTNGFISATSTLLFASEDGTISAWSPTVTGDSSMVVADRSGDGAVYKGIAIASDASGTFLYATDFHNGAVDQFDTNFDLVQSFTDGTIPSGFAPFGIQTIGGKLFVTYAKQLGPDDEDDDPGPGNGYVDVFEPDGSLDGRLVSQGVLNSPWGLAVAPEGFGDFAGDLLVGNFGDGTIHAFDLSTGALVGQVLDPDASPMVIDGLWALRFGNGDSAGSVNNLYFTAGLDGESHGLLGRILAVPGNANGLLRNQATVGATEEPGGAAVDGRTPH